MIELVYWDDDRIDSLGIRSDPRFRPAWSPETLIGANYLGRSFAMRAPRSDSRAGLGDAAGGAAEWDLLLRSDLDAARVARLPRVLTHLAGPRPEASPEDAVRVVHGSTSSGPASRRRPPTREARCGCTGIPPRCRT